VLEERSLSYRKVKTSLLFTCLTKRTQERIIYIYQVFSTHSIHGSHFVISALSNIFKVEIIGERSDEEYLTNILYFNFSHVNCRSQSNLITDFHCLTNKRIFDFHCVTNSYLDSITYPT